MIATGSSLERLVRCRASSALPRVWRESSDDAEAGTARHAYLERIANGATPDESLAQVPEAHRATCAAIDLDDLAGELRMSAEVALAYRPSTDTARVLGQGLARDYSAVAEDEIPLTVDLAGIAPDRVEVGDYKTGWRTLPPAAVNWQMRGGALALARAFDRDEAGATLIYVRDGAVIRRDRAEFDALDLLGFAADLRRAWDRALADRESGAHVEPTEGPWCRYCPAAQSCPAKVGLIRAALAGELSGPVTTATAAALYPRLDDAIKLLGKVKAEIVAMAAKEPILLSAAPDGTETWLGEVVGEGNERLDATIAIEAAATVLSVPPDELAAFQREVADLSVTKSALEAAAKKRAPRGKAATAMRTILDAVRTRGGASRPVKRGVEVYTVKAADAAKEKR